MVRIWASDKFEKQTKFRHKKNRHGKKSDRNLYCTKQNTSGEIKTKTKIKWKNIKFEKLNENWLKCLEKIILQRRFRIVYWNNGVANALS